MASPYFSVDPRDDNNERDRLDTINYVDYVYSERFTSGRLILFICYNGPA